MKAAIITQLGSPVAGNVQVVTDWPTPEPAAGEVLVRTEASALNHLDLWVGRGLPGMEEPIPRITGSDGAGIVESVGDGVDEAWIGKRIALNAAIDRPQRVRPGAAPAGEDFHVIGEHTHGTHGAFFTAPVSNVLDIGDTDPVAAAAFSLSFLTAWRMLTTRAHLRAGMTVLIPGIGGGVAQALLAIVKHMGGRVIVTSRHLWKLEKATEFGADECILDEGQDWSRAVRKATGKRGVDICADSVGRAVHLACIKSLARGGVFVTCGCTTGSDATTDLTRVFWNQLTLVGSTMGDMAEFRQVIALLRAEHLRPVIDTVVDAEDAARAYARLESGEQLGKVVLRWSAT